MRVIELNAKEWSTVLDFYAALKAALGSCAGHGYSPDAWVDSMIYGGMNQIEAPYVVHISGTASASSELRCEITLPANVIRDARQWRREHYGDDVDVTFQIAP